MCSGVGVVYAATGPKARKEVVRSVRSLRDSNRGIEACLFTDEGGRVLGGEFDRLEIFADPLFRSGDKIGAMLRSPFQSTLFLDSDTFVCGPIDDLFRLGDRWDLAASHAHWRGFGYREDIPTTFPELSSGVVAFERRPVVVEALQDWQTRYLARVANEEMPFKDQVDFRQALWDGGVKVCVLMPEYNFHVAAVTFAGGGSRVRIIHGHRDLVTRFAGVINKKLWPRAACRGKVIS